LEAEGADNAGERNWGADQRRVKGAGIGQAAGLRQRQASLMGERGNLLCMESIICTAERQSNARRRERASQASTVRAYGLERSESAVAALRVRSRHADQGDLGRRDMYKHILLPTDGSELSTQAVRDGIRLAKPLGARVTALHTTPQVYPSEMLGRQMIERSKEYVKQVEEEAARVLGAVEATAREAGVTCKAIHRNSDTPWNEIIKVATEQGCDLIVMASHGRHGVTALVLGSETTKVLTHSKIPVLVCR
jgi:nucleotide-binding universal stress UspA family protein